MPIVSYHFCNKLRQVNLRIGHLNIHSTECQKFKQATLLLTSQYGVYTRTTINEFSIFLTITVSSSIAKELP